MLRRATMMDLVTTLPVHDRAGNVLVDLRPAQTGLAESGLAETRLAETGLDERVPLPASLVVVTFAGRLLMVFDRWRGQWELPGGTLDPGETARQAAVRELAEETGIVTTGLDFAGVAEFSLARPARREYAAIYRCVLASAPRLVVNDEIAGFRWWDPRAPLGEATSPIDAGIGRWVTGPQRG